MNFLIKSEDKEIVLTSSDLFIQILNQAFEDFETNKNFDTELFVEEINKIMTSDKNFLLNSSNKQIYSIYFLAGYYYKIFINKNNVTIEKDDK